MSKVLRKAASLWWNSLIWSEREAYRRVRGKDMLHREDIISLYNRYGDEASLEKTAEAIAVERIIVLANGDTGVAAVNIIEYFKNKK
jgi:hypothetical protein